MSSMLAALDSYSLKPFTKALACLSRYGDDLTIFATPDNLSISATNSSMSAYCRFKFNKQFFFRFHVGTQADGARGGPNVDDVPSVTGQLLAKSILSILKHRTVEKTVDRCEFSIVEGASPAEEDDSERDSLESKLVVRLHCKHGVVKTHRLLLLTPTSLMAPGVPDVPYESRLTIGPRAIKDMIEHFPAARGAKSDPQLIWTFGDSEVEVKSLESSMDNKAKAQLSTEITISAEEFDTYDVHSPPVNIAFHLREFNATIAFAESMALSLDIRFTDPSAPMFIDIESDSSDALFVISTSHVQGSATGANAISAPNHRPNGQTPLPARKRQGGTGSPAPVRPKKPKKAAHRADPSEVVRAAHSGNSGAAGAGPSSQPHASGSGAMPPEQPTHPTNSSRQQREALFLPNSQASTANSQTLRESGLGLEEMGFDELTLMLEGDGEEVGFGSQKELARHDQDDLYSGRDSFELVDDTNETAIAPSQGVGQGSSKTFRPLFLD